MIASGRSFARGLVASPLLVLIAFVSLACGPVRDGEELLDAGVDAGTEADAGTDAGLPPPTPCGAGFAVPDARPLPVDVRDAVDDLRLADGTDRIEVYSRSQTQLTAAEIAQFGTRSCEAFKFNLERLQLEGTELPLLPALRIVILDDATYGAATGAPGSYGVTFSAWEGDGDAFVVPESALGNLGELDDTLAHELNHVIVGRLAPNDATMPWWAIEGLAIDMGSHFGKLKHGQVQGFVRSHLDGADGDDARLTFTRYDLEDNTQNLGQVGHDQSLSGFFLTYLELRHPFGSELGFADMPVRMLRTMRDNSDGFEFADSFKEMFGNLSLPKAKADYAQYLDDTVGDIDARLKGTVYE